MQLAAVAPRFRADMTGNIAPLVLTPYDYEADKTSGNQCRNIDRARDLKKDTAFINEKEQMGFHTITPLHRKRPTPSGLITVLVAKVVHKAVSFSSTRS